MCQGYPTWQCYLKMRILIISVTELYHPLRMNAIAFILNGRSLATLFRFFLILFENKLGDVINHANGRYPHFGILILSHMCPCVSFCGPQ